MRRIKPRRLKKENLTAYVLGNKKQRTRMRRDEEPLARLPVSNMKAFPRDDPRRSIFVWINTYNRPADLRNLLGDIYKSKGPHKLKILVVDDASTLDYDSVLNSFSGKLNIEYHKMDENHGKKGYWKLCTYAMHEIKKNIGYDYYMKVDDDGRLVDCFFDRCVNIWECIRDQKKICLNFRLDSRERKRVWTNVYPTLENHKGIPVYKSQWVDMDFFVTLNFFAAIRFRIRKPADRRWSNPYVSSGTGRDISTRLYKMGYNMYLTSQTLVIHDEHDSKMNPGERARNPLITKKITDPNYGKKRPNG